MIREVPDRGRRGSSLVDPCFRLYRSTTVLMSIHPRFVEAILTGAKCVEFRKRTLPDDTTHVLMYATSPVQRVMGQFEVSAQFSDVPASIWRRLRRFGDVTTEEFFGYYTDSSSAVAICVDRAHRYETPKTLAEIGWVGAPPRSFQRLETSSMK